MLMLIMLLLVYYVFMYNDFRSVGQWDMYTFDIVSGHEDGMHLLTLMARVPKSHYSGFPVVACKICCKRNQVYETFKGSDSELHSNLCIIMQIQKCQQAYRASADVPPSPASDASGSATSLFSRFSFT